MPLVAARALVLQSFAYSETSKILRLYTREHGLRSVIAKGAQRPRSRFGGLLEPFTEGIAGFSLREGRDLHTLSGWDLVRARQALGRSLAAFAGASLLAELALRLGTEDPHPEVYDLLAAAWDRMAAATQDEAEAIAVGAAWRLVSVLGFEPQTDACVLCARALDPAEPARFDGTGGGATCTRCRATGRLLAPGPRAELAALVRDGELPAPTPHPATHRALLRAFLEGQVVADRPLRSLELFLVGHAEGGGTGLA